MVYAEIRPWLEPAGHIIRLYSEALSHWTVVTVFAGDQMVFYVETEKV